MNTVFLDAELFWIPVRETQTVAFNKMLAGRQHQHGFYKQLDTFLGL